jgi:hypothetical protein
MEHRLRAMLAAAALTLGGCADAAPTGTAEHPPSSVPPSTAASAGSSEPGGSANTCGTTRTVSEIDNGRTICLARGSVLTVALAGSGWTPLTSQGNAVTPDDATSRDGRPAMFTAVREGTATLRSTYPCPTGGPRTTRCHAIRAFLITVEVR